jgi:hypothetical protein
MRAIRDWGSSACTSALPLACLLAAVVVMMWPAEALAKTRTGELRVQVIGLPVDQAPTAVLTGPGVRQRLSGSQVTLRHARPGRYALTVSQVRFGRDRGRVHAGATAYPTSRQVSVRVQAGHTATLTGDYGTIVNPGLRALRVPVLRVTGPPAHPRSVLLAGASGLVDGQVLSLPPSRALPNGVLARALSVSRHGSRVVVVLGRVSVFDVVPVANFDVPVHLEPVGAAADATAHATFGSPLGGCGPSIGVASGLYRSFKNARFSGGWNTVSLFGRHVPVGLTAGLDVDLTAGVQDLDGVSIGASCEVDIPWQAAIGPVPVTGAVFGNVHGSVDGGVGFDAQLGVHVHAGVTTVGTPPAFVFAPQVSFSHPSASVHAAGEVAVTAGFGAGVKFGLGSEWGADATVNIENDWDFTAQASYPDGSGCRTQAKFGSFSAEAKLGVWTVHTPSTPPFFTDTLWGPTNCEPQTSTPSPSPQPPPAPQPPSPPPPAASEGYGLVSCASTSLCRAVWGQEPLSGSAYNAYTDSNGRWSGPTALSFGGPILESLSCASTGFCMALGEDGDGVATSGGGWSSIPNTGDSVPYSVSCVSASFCMAVGLEGDAVVYNGSSWGTPVKLDSGAQVVSVSCTSPSFCVAVDYTGSAMTYNGSNWSAPQTIDPAVGSQHLSISVSCASTTFCLAVAGDGYAEIYDGTSWSAPHSVNGASLPLESVSCAQGTSFCAVVDSSPIDGSGEAYTYQSGAWRAWGTIDPGAGTNPTSVSCSSSTECVAVDRVGRALTYDGSSWSASSFAS